MKKFVVPALVGLLATVLPVSGFAPQVPTAVAAGVPNGASAYTPITPTRFADTRTDMGSFGFDRLGPTTIRVQITGRFGVPAGATAVVLNIASVAATGAGFVTAYPAGAPRPLAASLNVDQAGRIVANLTTVRLSAGGAVELYSNVAMDLVVDVAGTYAAVTGPVTAGRLVTFAGGAQRAYDSRTVGARLGPRQTKVVDLSVVGVPADAIAVAINLAAVDANPGFWTAYPSGNTLPIASSLNLDTAGQTRNSQGIVQMSPGTDSISVYTYGGGDLVVDVVGWFTGSTGPSSTDGLFVSTTPTRVLDTRDTFTLAPWGDTTIEFASQPPAGMSVAAVAMNIAIAEPWYVGFVTAYPAGVTRPGTANLNITAFDQIISNHAIVRNGTRGIALYTQNGTHMIVDVAGWYLGTPEDSTLPTPTIPTYDPTWAVNISAPTAPINVGVGYGPNIDAVINRGVAGLWTGLGGLGQPDQNVFFAHRTSHGGPFRYLNNMPVGSTFTITGANGVKFRYLVQRVDVIWPTASILLDIIHHTPGFTATLVACHPAGSTKYRLMVTGRLIGASLT